MNGKRERHARYFRVKRYSRHESSNLRALSAPRRGMRSGMCEMSRGVSTGFGKQSPHAACRRPERAAAGFVYSSQSLPLRLARLGNRGQRDDRGRRMTLPTGTPHVGTVLLRDGETAKMCPSAPTPLTLAVLRLFHLQPLERTPGLHPSTCSTTVRRPSTENGFGSTGTPVAARKPA